MKGWEFGLRILALALAAPVAVCLANADAASLDTDCNAGNASACYALAKQRYAAGDRKEASRLLSRACAGKSALSCHGLAVMYKKAGRAEASVGLFKRACDLGYAPSCARVSKDGSLAENAGGTKQVSADASAVRVRWLRFEGAASLLVQSSAAYVISGTVAYAPSIKGLVRGIFLIPRLGVHLTRATDGSVFPIVDLLPSAAMTFGKWSASAGVGVAAQISSDGTELGLGLGAMVEYLLPKGWLAGLPVEGLLVSYRFMGFERGVDALSAGAVFRF